MWVKRRAARACLSFGPWASAFGLLGLSFWVDGTKSKPRKMASVSYDIG